MAVIKPFRGLRYNRTKVGDLSDVCAPPYDVIDQEQKQRLLDRHPANIVRLILGKTQPDRALDEAVYPRAARTYAQWRETGVLVQDPLPSLYIYDQHFEINGRSYCRRGFVARVLLEPLGEGTILPHEQTLSGPKEDRMRLMRACRANLSQIFAVHSDADGAVSDLLTEACEKVEPTVDFVDADEGVRQVLRVVSDREVVSAVADAMRERSLYIADGHHRYETALQLSGELRAGRPVGEDPADYVAIDCVAIEQPGMVILPTHRLLKAGPLDVESLLNRLGEDFEVKAASMPDPAALQTELAEQGRGSIGAFLGGRFYLLRVKSYDEVDRLYAEHCESWRRLDVATLHALIIEKHFDITFDKVKSSGAVEFVQNVDKAVERVKEGGASALFILNPTGVDQVMAIAEAGDRMPPKSTYFYPKLVSGLVLNPLEQA